VSDLNKVLAGVTENGVTLVGLVAPADGSRVTGHKQAETRGNPPAIEPQFNPLLRIRKLCEKRNTLCPGDSACFSSRLIAPGAMMDSQPGWKHKLCR
jgi:hypothetical protein